MQRKACTSSARSRFNRRCCWLTRCFDQCGNQFQSEFIWVYVKFMLGCLNAWPLFEKPNSISLTCISWGVSDRNAWNQAVTFQTHETQETCPTRDSKGMSLAVCLPWRGVWILWQTARQGLLWLPSLLLIQSLLGQATVVAPNALVEWRQLSSSPPPSQKQQEVPCNPRCLQLWPHCCKRETYRRDPKAVRSQDVENHLIQSDFGTLKLRPVLTGLLSNGKLGRKLLRTLETPLIRAKHVHSCQTQAQTLL